MRLIIFTTLFLIPLIGFGSFPIKKGELINIEKNNLISIEANPLYKTGTSQKFIDWSKIPKILFYLFPQYH